MLFLLGYLNHMSFGGGFVYLGISAFRLHFVSHSWIGKADEILSLQHFWASASIYSEIFHFSVFTSFTSTCTLWA